MKTLIAKALRRPLFYFDHDNPAATQADGGMKGL